MSALTDPDSTQKTGAERRREQRYEVKLPGDLGVDGEVYSVTIADLSGSGALLVMENPPDEGAVADLWINGFGDVEVKIMFSGDGVCGVMFTRPAEHRDRLLKWLMQQLAEGKARL